MEPLNYDAIAKGLLDMLESDFGQSGEDIRIEAICCELEAVFQHGYRAGVEADRKADGTSVRVVASEASK